MAESNTKARKKATKKKISIYDADHPLRRCAIDIIKCAVSPLIQRGVDGKKYYDLEDTITMLLQKRLRSRLKTPITPDIARSLTVVEEDEEYEEDDWNDDDDANSW